MTVNSANMDDFGVDSATLAGSLEGKLAAVARVDAFTTSRWLLSAWHISSKALATLILLTSKGPDKPS